MKYTIEATILDTIALCYIKNEFESFNENLIKYIKEVAYKGEPLSRLDKISHGQKVLFSWKTKKFYKENKTVIDTINKYSDIQSFIYNNYNLLFEATEIKFEKEELYKYIMKNELNIVKILTLLNKLKELGIKKFEFNENVNFTNETITISNCQSLNSKITYYDNIKIIPNYNKDEIEYSTTGSNYKLILSNLDICSVFSLSLGNEYICLNSLIFDISRLPENISDKYLFGIIRQEAEKRITESKGMRNSVDLSENIDSLDLIIDEFLRTIILLDNEEYKKELFEIIYTMKENIPALRNISIKYEQDLIDNYENITQKLLDSQKQEIKTRKRKK